MGVAQNENTSASQVIFPQSDVPPGHHTSVTRMARACMELQGCLGKSASNLVRREPPFTPPQKTWE